jgi:ubiquinone/menaquinone biosynthesis C-methylase UbiE
VARAARPDYGLDAPGLVRAFLLGGASAVVVSMALILWAGAGLLAILGNLLLWPGLIFFIEGLLMIMSSRYGKMRARDRLLDGLHLRGDEHVLDVGCGRGLLLIGAAKRLPRGEATGLDPWSQADLSDNSQAATLANAQIEGVAGRVKVQSGDMRAMPFPDSSFDAAVASLSIHNIYNREGRREAINEIVRVLRPGGSVALQDMQHVGKYAEDLRAAGMENAQTSGLSFWIFPPVRVVTGRKPAR